MNGSLLNAAALRRYALDHWNTARAHKKNRVSREFFDRCEAAVRAHVRGEIARGPSQGKTL